jgi:hypothetical protein
MLKFQVLDDRVVHRLSRDGEGLGDDDVGERQDRDVRRAAADIDDHVRPRLVNRNPRSEARGSRLLEKVDLARARPGRRVEQGSLLNRGDPHRNGQDDTGAEPAPPLVDPAQELGEHRLRHVEVRDHPGAQRAHRFDAQRSPPQHLLGGAADRLPVEEDMTGALLDGHDRRLVEDDALSVDAHHRVGGPEVDSQVGREATKEPREVHTGTPGAARGPGRIVHPRRDVKEGGFDGGDRLRVSRAPGDTRRGPRSSPVTGRRWGRDRGRCCRAVEDRLPTSSARRFRGMARPRRRENRGPSVIGTERYATAASASSSSRSRSG